MFRTKDNTFVYCAVNNVIMRCLQKAAEFGITIDHIVHKVCI